MWATGTVTSAKSSATTTVRAAKSVLLQQTKRGKMTLSSPSSMTTARSMTAKTLVNDRLQIASPVSALVVVTFPSCCPLTQKVRYSSSSTSASNQHTPSGSHLRPMSSLAVQHNHEYGIDYANEYKHRETTTESAPATLPKMLLMLGKPGGGKGTISGKLLKDFHQFHHLSTGDLLRQHVRNQTDLGQEAKEYMDKGALVPDHLMINLVLHDASQILSEHKKNNDTPKHRNNSDVSNDCLLLLDGFPRNVEQAKALEEQQVPVEWVVNLNIPTETIVERIDDRWIHPASGRVYSYSYKPPKVQGKDDVTGEPLIQRVDDQPETVRKRLQSYDKVTAPLVEYYEQKGILQTFSGTQSDVLYPQVQKWLRRKGL